MKLHSGRVHIITIVNAVSWRWSPVPLLSFYYNLACMYVVGCRALGTCNRRMCTGSRVVACLLSSTSWYRSTGTGGVGTYLSIRIATTRQHCLHTRYSILHTKSCQYCAVQHNRTIMPLLFSCSLFQSVKRMNIQIIVVVTVLCRLHVML